MLKITSIKNVSLSQLNLDDRIYTFADYLTWQFDERVEIIKEKAFPINFPNHKNQAISRELVGNFGTILKSLFSDKSKRIFCSRIMNFAQINQ